MTASPLDQIDTFVVLMLENRSFDHMLGWLYAASNNLSSSGQAFDGLTGAETNPGSDGSPVSVFRITSATPNASFMPGADPGEGYNAMNDQLFGSITAPATQPPTSNGGFVTDFAYTLAWQAKEKGWTILPGTTEADIMGCYDSAVLPILSGLAQGFAVCDRWFSPAPTETLPNRAFAHAGTSQGHLKDTDAQYTAPTIFAALTTAGVSWMIYGGAALPLARGDFSDLQAAPDANFGLFGDFQTAAAAGTLPAYSFLEPTWSGTGQNDQHPVSDIAAGEQLIHDVYYALRNGPKWASTLLIVTYDESGGLYDHVPPPWTAPPPDATAGEQGFGFNRFGPRVPTVLISPLIPAGGVFRAPAGSQPHDHTVILKTLETRYGLAPLTARDAGASDLSAVLTLTAPRTDDPLAGVAVPPLAPASPAAQTPSHLQQLQAQMAADLPVKDAAGGLHHVMPAMTTSAEYDRYIAARTAAWKAQKSVGAG
jgi:phospholipase C